MKRTQLKDAVRNIWKQRVSWFAIVIIAMLSVMAYLGIHFASHGIARNANSFYDQTHFRDIEIVSTLLLTQDDLDAVLAVEGVRDAEGLYRTNGKIESEGLRANVDVVSLTERISTPLLLEGRLPESADECAAEQPVLQTLGLSIGDTVRVTDAHGAAAEHLLRNEFVITGVVDHPDHACWPAQIPGNRDLVVLPEAFDRDALDGCFMKAVLLLEDVGGADRFGDEYESAVEAVMQRLEALRAAREETRYSEIKNTYQAKLDENRGQLDEARDELDEARRDLDDGYAAADEGERKLQDAQTQLAESKRQLEASQAQLEDASNQLYAAEAQLNQSKAELREAQAVLQEAKSLLDEGRAELEDGWSLLEDAKASVRASIRSAVDSVCGEAAGQIQWAGRMPSNVDSESATAMDFWITADYRCDLNQSLADNVSAFIESDAISDELLEQAYVSLTGTEEGFDPALMRAELSGAAASAASSFDGSYSDLASSCARWDEGHASYYASLSEYRSGKAQYDAGMDQVAAGEQSYRNALDRYEAGRRDYEEGLSAYEQGLADYEAGREELAAKRSELADGELAYAQALKEYEEGEARLAQAQAQFDSLDPCRWVILDLTGNPSYLNISNAVNNTADMGMTFALVFVLVGALVIYATVGRIVDEQRRLVGATKALGLFNREIFAKYLLFGVSATVLGMLLGIAGGYFGIQRILLYVYGRYYVYGAGKNAFLGGMTAGVLLAGTALASLAVYSACSSLMRATATNLMQEKTPERRRGEGAGGRRKGSLYTRLILRNMRSDCKRVVVTVVSVAGCCALLVAGFTMRQSVMKALNAQFDEITKYDLQIRFDPEVSDAAQGELEALLTESGTDWVLAHASTRTFSVGGKLLSANLLCGDLAALDRFYARLDPDEDRALERPGEGVWVRQRVAELDGVAAGDIITFYDSAMKPCRLPVAGIFRIYAGQEMILDTEQYEKYFGQAPESNVFFLRLNGADADSLKTRAHEIAGVEELTDVAETRAMYQSLASVLNLIALMFVGIAGLMAFFILLNLVNMQLNQKKRELTVMRINGFSVREVKAYVLRESILSTALGILLGLGTGSLLGYRVIRLLEGVSVRFMRNIQWEAWVIGAAITVIYAVIIQMAALRKVKGLKLTDLN